MLQPFSFVFVFCCFFFLHGERKAISLVVRILLVRISLEVVRIWEKAEGSSYVKLFKGKIACAYQMHSLVKTQKTRNDTGHLLLLHLFFCISRVHHIW